MLSPIVVVALMPFRLTDDVWQQQSSLISGATSGTVLEVAGRGDSELTLGSE